MKFKHVIEDLQEERVIATLWGCIERRYRRKATHAGETDIPIEYNQIKGRIHLRFENENKKNRNQTTEEEKGGGSACFGTKGKMEAAIIKK